MSMRDEILAFARSRSEPITSPMIREALKLPLARYTLFDMTREGYLFCVGQVDTCWGPMNQYSPTNKQTVGSGKYDHTGKRKKTALVRVMVDEGRTEKVARVYLPKRGDRLTVMPLVRIE